MLQTGVAGRRDLFCTLSQKLAIFHCAYMVVKVYSKTLIAHWRMYLLKVMEKDF
jgi:hypothetical protein